MKIGCSWTFLVTVALASVLLAIPPAAQDLQRGLRSFQDIMSGKRKLEQLSPEEKQEVIIIIRRLQAQRFSSDKSPECRNALSLAENAASELSDYSERLRNCAESQEYNDDCSTEFRRVRNAHSDYEDAVSSVSSYCR